jgi:hypothetical protein
MRFCVLEERIHGIVMLFGAVFLQRDIFPPPLAFSIQGGAYALFPPLGSLSIAALFRFFRPMVNNSVSLAPRLQLMEFFVLLSGDEHAFTHWSTVLPEET